MKKRTTIRTSINLMHPYGKSQTQKEGEEEGEKGKGEEGWKSKFQGAQERREKEGSCQKENDFKDLILAAKLGNDYRHIWK